MTTEWVLREVKSEKSGSESEPLFLSDPVGRFLGARGLATPEEAESFLNFSLKDLKDPSCLKDMDKAVQRLVEAYRRQEPVCVYGDFDMDGTPALALVVRGLRFMGFQNVHYMQPHRHNDGYGFHAHLVEKFVKEKNVSLFITVDVGITDHAAVAKAKELGADVIITDHHQVNGSAPAALAVVNPNQPDCPSEMGYLCGTGVGFYIVMALRRELKKQNLLTQDFDIKNLLDCFAIGTVADMVPLVKENRILVKHGLKVLEKTGMIGLRQLLIALKLSDKPLSAQDVGMRFVPKLNSLSRLETELKAVDLFLVEDPAEGQQMVAEVLKNNQRRVLLLEEAEKLLEGLVAQSIHMDESCLFFWSDQFHRGLVGLLATQLVQKFQKPAFVGAQTADGHIVGSARIPEGREEYNVFEALKSAEAFLEKYGGHPAAAGFDLLPENADKLGEALRAFFDQTKPLGPKTTVHYYDHDMSFSQVKSFMNHWDRLEPFGVQFSPPVFRLSGLKLESQKALKGGHLRLTFRDSRQQTVEVMWFFPDQPEALLAPESLYSLLCEPQWNDFMGSRRVQLLLKDIKKAE